MIVRKLAVFLAALIVAVSGIAAMADTCGGGGGEGGTSGSESATKAVMAAALQYVKDGDCGRFMPIALKNLARMDEGEKGGVMYLMSMCYFKGDQYDLGKSMILGILNERYESVTELLGDREKVRTLAAAIFAEEAAKRGMVEDVQEAQRIVAPDASVDRLLVRDGEGSLVGRTKLSYVLRFHEARAYKNSQKAEQALSILKELSFSSGKIMVDGKVEGLREAVDRMASEIRATAALWLSRFCLS